MDSLPAGGEKDLHPAALVHRWLLEGAARFLYDGLEDDEQLRPLFPRDLAISRAVQKLFFEEWLGGPRRYSDDAHAGLVHRHDDIAITPELADRWLRHFGHALRATVAVERDRKTIFAHVRDLAHALVNEQVTPADGSGQPRERHGHAPSNGGRRQLARCGTGARIVKHATELARRGDVDGVDAAVEEVPGLLRPTYAASIMRAAVWADRTEVVRTLLARGVGVDHPFYFPVRVTGAAFERVIFVTPLCTARLKRRSAAESVLLGAGAREDVFTAAFLGDHTSLARMLAAEPSLAGATDPAADVLDITPVEHAVAGGQLDALRLVLDHVHRPLTGARALRGAAGKGNVRMVELLLGHGADATRIGVGRWVLHPELAPMLADRGARIDSSGSWIGATCTGNQGRKDDPDYVYALLRHGARAEDRRSGDHGVTAGVATLNATALHYAAKAGFVKTIDVLLNHGADPQARDSRGRRPLDWLDQAAPSVPRAAVRALLAPKTAG